MNRESIKHKLIFITVIVTFLVLLFCGILSSVYFLEILKKQVYQDEKQKLNQVAIHIASIQDEMMKLSTTIAADPDIQGFLSREDSLDVVDLLSAKQKIAGILSQYLNVRQDSYSIFVVTDKNVYSGNGQSPGDNLTQELWYQSVEENGFSGVHEIYQQKYRADSKVISYIMQFYDMNNGTSIMGKIIVNVDYNQIIKYVAMNDSVTENYWLEDRNKTVLWRSRPGEIEEYQSGAGFGQFYKIHQEQELKDGWMLSAVISQRAILYKLRYIFIFFGLLFLGALTVLAVILWNSIHRVLKPIGTLVEAARKVGDGDFDCVAEIETADEFQKLGETFNAMVHDIKNHMEESIQYEKTAREMEINRLMLQINPHFIYNTLNSIVFMASIQECEDVVKFTKAFISLLHDTLNVEQDEMFITLEQEMTNVKNYLVLQSYRYANKFQVSYEIAEDCFSCLVPNVLIQPLVENAVFHGLCGKERKGNLKICAVRTRDGHVEITVEDDGVGMSQERAVQLLSEDIRIQGGMRKIGIANVKERIHYIYGDNYGMQMKSSVGAGTEIKIRIPYQEKSGGQED